MKAKVIRPIPGSRDYTIGEVYVFEGDTQWLVKGRYIEPIVEPKEKAVITPSEKR